MKHQPAVRVWDRDRLYAYGLRLLTYRPRSEQEIRQRFQKRGASPDLIDETLQRLSAAGFIDDTSFALAWVESRRRSAPRGQRVLKGELLRKGVPRAAIDSALTAEVDEVALARGAAAKKARSLAAEADPVFARRLTDFLLRRGFDYDVAAQVVRQALADRQQA